MSLRWSFFLEVVASRTVFYSGVGGLRELEVKDKDRS